MRPHFSSYTHLQWITQIYPPNFIPPTHYFAPSPKYSRHSLWTHRQVGIEKLAKLQILTSLSVSSSPTPVSSPAQQQDFCWDLSSLSAPFPRRLTKQILIRDSVLLPLVNTIYCTQLIPFHTVRCQYPETHPIFPQISAPQKIFLQQYTVTTTALKLWMAKKTKEQNTHPTKTRPDTSTLNHNLSNSQMLRYQL